ncbi:MAG: hypothetical protein HC903_20850 [Methylacidiphilales bacterium]|nr:hypothetical protein [Candidatus Methylacidiphilales bacterium]
MRRLSGFVINTCLGKFAKEHFLAKPVAIAEGMSANGTNPLSAYKFTLERGWKLQDAVKYLFCCT